MQNYLLYQYSAVVQDGRRLFGMETLVKHEVSAYTPIGPAPSCQHKPYVSFPLRNKISYFDLFLSLRITSNQLPRYPHSKFRTSTKPKFHDANFSYVSSHLFVSTCKNTHLSTLHHSNFLSCMYVVRVILHELGLDGLIDWGMGALLFSRPAERISV
jgi:hypothetical protein